MGSRRQNALVSPDEEAALAKVFKQEGVDKAKVLRPVAPGFNLPGNIYVCCDWMNVYVQKDIARLFQDPVPESFERLRLSLDAGSTISTYILYDADDDYSWVPVECGICDEVFSLWNERMAHRREKHDIVEDPHPLPEC